MNETEPQLKVRSWGVDTYSKWEKFDESDDEEQQKNKPRIVSTRFDLGDGDIQPIEETFTDNIDINRLKLLVQKEKETWQVVIRKLRVWSKCESGNVFRPVCALVGSLYPEGHFLNQQLCENNQQGIPSPEDLMGLLQRTMLDPMQGEQRRPKGIVFADKKIANCLYKSLEVLRIECSVLSEAEGFEQYLEALSASLIDGGVASKEKEAEGSSAVPLSTCLLRAHDPDNSNATMVSGRSLLENFYAAATKLWGLTPWAVFGPRQALEVQVPAPVKIDERLEIPSGRIWLCVHAPAPGKEKGLTKSLHHNHTASETEGGEPAGISVFFSRLDLEARTVPLDSQGKRPELWRPAPQCHRTGTKEKAEGKKLKRTKPRTFDIRSGQEICYLNAQAQREDWLEVKPFSKPLEERDKGLEEGKLFWSEKEYSMLYEDPTMIPFLDLEEIETQKWKLPTALPGGDGMCVDECIIPSPMELRQGAICTPDAEGIVWLTRALKVLTLLATKVQAEGEPDCMRYPEGENLLQLSDWTCFGMNSQSIKVVASPIIFQAEMEAALERQRQKKTTQQQLKSEQSPIPLRQESKEPLHTVPSNDLNTTTALPRETTHSEERRQPCPKSDGEKKQGPKIDELNAIEGNFEINSPKSSLVQYCQIT